MPIPARITASARHASPGRGPFSFGPWTVGSPGRGPGAYLPIRQKAGLVPRERAPDERRAVIVSLTATGRRRVADVLPVHIAAIKVGAPPAGRRRPDFGNTWLAIDAIGYNLSGRV